MWGDIDRSGDRLAVMPDDAMTALRHAWHSGDGAAMMAAVEQVGPDVCLQWAGDLVRAALRVGVPDAAPLAERTCSALRHRGWAGDDELADAIDDARRVRACALLELPVDLAELGMLLDAGGEFAAVGRIDLRTGQVWPDSVLDDGGWDGAEDELDDDERWLAVWPLGSGAAYGDMADFAATRTRRLREKLDVALDGRGAFRRFKDVLFDWPDDRAEWFAFSEDRSRGRARAWLADAGYQPAVVAPT